jgi:hypothetical protein
MANTTFENKLNAAIEEKGYRISPRLGLEDRLSRYIELTWIDRGEPLTKDEVDAVVALTMVNNFGDASNRSWRSTEASDETWSSAESQPRRSSRRSAEASNETWSSAEASQSQSWRSAEASWQPRRSARLATREIVNYAEDDSEDTWQPRRSTRTGSHPMVRRSQVTRR